MNKASRKEYMYAQRRRVYEFLLGGEHTTIEIMQHCNVADPRSTIRDLRSIGIEIKDKWVNDPGGNKHKKYWIEQGNLFSEEMYQ